ncbi:putrescine transport system ATP-binding protein [Pseudoxanthobacter soli DSM 19599]|uniref:Spermidine/putrescine import ATP-binding protein PotA n=1 Tax=Pseudoxanthobacter soli DSM 19599 TaxID=1123029 RepID=A0A1M7ZHZ3_9HYPH|nr:ABC transporter ATP-binding protein [Pseudoxanthobacter soli]SHO64442.1 putrescine transport system ATP-binding protein [Pseudoxanthobacter soli DSM 19599]
MSVGPVPIVLSIDNVVKRYGSATAVAGISLDIRENEFFALLGPSGCGKTTLLRMLAGFETPTAGRILIDGVDVAPVPPNRRPVNLMFQSYALFPHMSVRANIAYGLEMEGLKRAEIKARVDAILETTHLAPLADRRPEQLSGGQRQRVALARALVKRPRVLLLDEPLGALDKKLREAMQIELKRLQHEVGITFVMVTHDQEEALVMADRMAVLKDGRLLQCDGPHAIYEQPADRFVADFIGVMNFADGTAAVDGLTAKDGTAIRGERPAGLAPGAAAVAAVRPERLKLGAEGADNRAAGRIEAVAYHGLDLQLHVRTALSPKPFLVRLTADAADRRPVAIGEDVVLGWSAADTRLFPA